MSDRADSRNAYAERPPVRRKRRKKTPWQKFKEAYLPLLLVLVALAAVIALIVGVVKLVGGSDKKPNPSDPSDTQETQQQVGPSQDAVRRMEKAQELASHYDYDAAMALLEPVKTEDLQVAELLKLFGEEKAKLKAWEDPSHVTHLSFQPLIEDTARAFDGDENAEDYAHTNLTTSEFKAVLDQLYQNGFVLVSMQDMASLDASGKFVPGEILLPEGKKPVVFSLVPAHYTAAKAGDGFAMGLALDGSGKVVSEYVKDGTKVSGSYDFVTILEDFIAQHPDFSYHGARAILGLTGEEGPLGYDFSKPEEAQEAKKLSQVLTGLGYRFASFSYDDLGYGSASEEEMNEDVRLWEEKIESVVGPVDILIFVSGDELDSYEGGKFDTLYNAGFRYFCGLDNYVENWGKITDNCVRQDRRTINGNRIVNEPGDVEDLFDASLVVSSDRP